MKENFIIKKIKNNIFLIYELYYKETANMYLFVGEKHSLLLDSGTGMFNIKKFLEKKGFKNIYLTLTHSHFDHAGGIKYFSKEKIIIPKNIIKNLNNNKLLGTEYFNKKDFNNISKNTLNNYSKNFKINLPKMNPLKNLNINIKNFNFDLINTPGHTDDSFIFFDSKNKILVTGDTLYDGEIYYKMKNSNKRNFIKSLNKIIKLDYNYILPGHNKIIDKGKADKIAKKWIKELK